MASGSTPSRKALDRARALHHRGDLAGAERLYLAELRNHPASVEALHLLGLLNAQSGNPEAARQYFDRALGLDPGRAELHFLRADIASGLGLPEQAIDGYRQALAIRAEFPEALVNLGDLLLQQGRAEEALPLFDRALQLRPGDTAALNNRGNALQALKRHDEALQCFDRLLRQVPDSADVYNNRASALLSLSRPGQAAASCRKALELRPGHPLALLNLGRAQAAEGDLADALQSYAAALSARPQEFDAWCERAMVLLELQRYADARACYEKALALRPESAAAWSDMGSILLHLGEYPAALRAYDRSLHLREQDAGTWANRGLALQFLGRHEEAAPAYEKSLALDPGIPYAPGRLAWLRLNMCDWREHAPSVERIVRGVHAGERAAEPFELLFLADCAADQLACARIYAQDKYPQRADALWRGECYRHDRIRIAYLSGDFRDHPTSYLLAGLLESHARARFEVFGFSHGPLEESPTAARVAAAFEHYADVREATDRELAALLRGHEIDIAVNLMGYTSFGRTGVYALRPCPVHVNYLGYPGTLGAQYCDYIIADSFVIPAGHERHYAECVVRMPDTFQANDADRRPSPLAPRRDDLGLPNTGIVYCSFNKGSKITPQLFDLWMAVLKAVAGSVLWLQGGNPSLQRNLRREAAARGVDGQRLVFAPWANYADHLARLAHADVALDTLPFNGGATASDALWCGVPVITCPGDAFAARMAGSLLQAIGMSELVAPTLEQYRALAMRLGDDPQRLDETKRKLAAHRLTHPLFDTDRFRRHIEAAYEIMYQRYQAGEPPAGFSVPAIAEVRADQA